MYSNCRFVLRYVKTHNFDPPLSGGRLDAASLNFTQEWCVAGGVNDNDNDVGGIAFLSMSEHKKQESLSLLLHNTNLPAVSCSFSVRFRPDGPVKATATKALFPVK